MRKRLVLFLLMITPLLMGAFPTTGILDSFTRGNEEPVAGWTDINNGIKLDTFVITGDTGSNDTAGWNATTYGPNSEAYATVLGAQGNKCAVMARLTTLVSGTYDGYFAYQASDDNTQLYRLDNGGFTEIGTEYSFVMASGDKIGIECIGTAIKAYIKDGAAAWGAVVSTTDGAHGNAGYVGAWIDDNNIGQRALDDFGGGTIGVAPTGGQVIFINTVMLLIAIKRMRNNGKAKRNISN